MFLLMWTSFLWLIVLLLLFSIVDLFLFSFVLLLYVFSWVFAWSGSVLYVEGVFNFLMVFLSVIVFFIVLLSEGSYVLTLMSSFLVLVGVFYFFVVNFMLFYVLFEISMLPILLMVLGFGQQIEKVSSVYYLLFYSFFTAFPLLFLLFNLDSFYSLVYLDNVVSFEFLVLFSLGFLMKFPVYFLHFWLPNVHVEAPTSASIFLASLLLKFGTLGVGRVLFTFCYSGVWLFLVVSFVGFLLCSFLATYQSDCNSLIAYSSVVHMSFLLFTFIVMGLSANSSALLIILSHGYVSALAFYVVGFLFHVTFTRLVYFINSLYVSGYILFLVISFVMVLNCGFPPSVGFYSEFLGVLSGVYWLKSCVVVLVLYFFVSFYYSLYFFVSVSSGSGFVMLGIICVFCAFPFLVMSFNIFVVSLF